MSKVDKPLSYKEIQENARLQKIRALEIAAQDRKDQITQQMAAQIAALACSIPRESIKTGVSKVVLALRKKPKTLYDYNKERVRDTRYGKAESTQKNDNALANMEKFAGTYNFYSSISDPNSYLRDYSYKSFDAFKLHVNQKFATFENIEQIDLSGQLLGDAKFREMCEMLPRCSVVSLSVATNHITDIGLEYLARVLRSLKRLETLILADNNFTDNGVQMLFGKDVYSPTLKMVDLSRNNLDHRSAWYLGEMFGPDIKCDLEALHLGGRLGKTGWGDNFVRVLLNTLSKPGYRPLHRLSIPDAALTSAGVETLCTLIVCNDELEMLNISKTGIYAGSKQFLALALSVNSSLQEVYLGRCGLTKLERFFFEELRKKQYPLTWQEKVFISIGLARELTECSRTYHELITTQYCTDWTITPPLPFPHIDKEIGKMDFDPMLTSESMFWSPLDIKNRILSCDVYFKYLAFLKRIVTDCYKLLPENLANNDNIISAHDKMDERKKIMAFNYSVTRSLCTRLASQNEAASPINKKKKKKGDLVGSVAKSKQNKVSLDVEAIAMCVEDLRSSVVEYSTTIEAYVSEMFKTYLVYEKCKEQDSSQDGGHEILKEEIPYYGTIGLPACFVHYVYTFDPAEKDRERRAALQEIKFLTIKGMEDMRAENRARKIRPIIGARFHMKKGDECIPQEPGEMMVTNKSVYANLGELKQTLKKRLQAIVNPGLPEDNNAMLPGGSTADGDAILLQMKSYDDEEEVFVRKPTRFLVAKKEMLNRYRELFLEELDDAAAEFNLSRSGWPLEIGCNRQYTSEINKEIYKNEITIEFEEELNRSEMNNISMQTLNTTRADEHLSQRLKVLREVHITHREKELHD